MATQMKRMCQLCHGTAVRETPGVWACHNCGLAWKVGTNPTAAINRHDKVVASKAAQSHQLRTSPDLLDW